MATQFELGHHMSSQNAQCLFLIGTEFTRHFVDYAQGAESVTVRGDQRRAGIKSDFWVGSDERIFRESFVQGGVWDDEEVRLLDGMAAKGDVARSFVYGDPDLGFEPLTI